MAERRQRGQKKSAKQPYRKERNTTRDEPVAVQISNLPSKNIQEILEFLSKSIQFNPAKTVWERDDLVIICKTTREARNLKQNDGIEWKGKKIGIRFNHSYKFAEPPGLIEEMGKIVLSRYNPASHFLDLERFVFSTEFKAMGSRGFNQDPKTTKFGSVLCKLISQQCPNVETISFAANRIESLLFFENLSTFLPGLKNLSFKDNNLKTYDDLKGIQGSKFTELRELILAGNPVMEKELKKKGGEINFKSRVKSLFPSLKIIDGEVLLDEIKFGIEDEADMPVTVKCGFFDSEITLSTAQAFLLQYYGLFDKDRKLLASFYEDTSLFSLSLCNVPQSRQKNSAPLDLLFKGWSNTDRSLKRVTQADKRVENLYNGSDSIISAFELLPKTTHPLQEPAEKKKFVFDTFQQGVAPNVYLYIYVHGEVSMAANGTKRSFDRTFVLVPAMPGSRAATAGLPVSIMNDMLTLRPFNDNFAWKDAVSLVPQVQPPQNSTNLPDQAGLLALQQSFNLSEPQHAQVIVFAQTTGLNYPFSLQCLMEMEWSNERAYQAFENAKSQIPPEAFKV